jgi:hypothetical protein
MIIFFNGYAPFRKRPNHALQLFWADGLTSIQGSWRAAKNIAHPTRESHELSGLNLSMTTAAKMAPAKTMVNVRSLRLVLFIVSLQS